ncbi:MAG: hypothetical protein O2971_19680 [Proteobacteria bacterium]|nr:hypothetical protein [Pseudomonadota bacterium]
MRALTDDELELVHGGVGIVGAAIGGVTGAVVSARNGGNIGNIIGAASLGAVSGFFGGIAGATTGAARYMFGAYAIEIGFLGSEAASGS